MCVTDVCVSSRDPTIQRVDSSLVSVSQAGFLIRLGRLQCCFGREGELLGGGQEVIPVIESGLSGWA